MGRDWRTKFRYGIHEFCYTLMTFPRAWQFMLNHRLWTGLRQYGWVARGLMVVGVLAGLFMISEVVDWFQGHADAPLYALAIGSDSLLLRLVWDFYESLSEGTLNWVVLVLLEVVIYHFMRRTLQIILRKDVEAAHQFRPFLQAQIRMIQVSIMALILQEILLNAGGALLPGGLEWVFAVVAQSVILGYAIADNYNEQFGLTIRQSLRHLRRHYIGICMGLGLPLFLLLKVPVVGTLLGPLVTSVAAAIVLREKSDLHLVGYRMSPAERKKAAARAARRERKAQRKAARSLS
ncbi:hypothetical protein GGR26_000496 [Lewinella marina]|uniref:Uncharacterized protein n=1 Tax=Neolewinella marina TaxID=438751 RepID=A0A2G0CJD7_9BACT|nr:hypothetical protein [Neolewinella marina]NJB84751.1 hypothetical protein [Neolewinella marina]PHL00090.1 hypothetical protein CGL56_03350 [Neolewinella marina]